ncbi:MAG: T9SS type A sorting domain-containing protein [Fibrobacteria bacterium]|nr:T9SS type A sorting domain-containing protein [Fibrobacteria bacterium]
MKQPKRMKFISLSISSKTSILGLFLLFLLFLPDRGYSVDALNVGDVYYLLTDGYFGYERDSGPWDDANDGVKVSGANYPDNPHFKRHKVSKAHMCPEVDPPVPNLQNPPYWYTSRFIFNEGEPDPAEPQWVDYVPPIDSLGAGTYKIEILFRNTENRPDYDAEYSVIVPGADTVTATVNQKSGVEGDCMWFTVGEVELTEGSFVRAEDPGAGSLVFGPGKFTLLNKVTSTHNTPGEKTWLPSAVQNEQLFQILNGLGNNINWSVYSVTGSKVAERSNIIEKDKLLPGLYFVQIHQKNAVHTFKILLK